MTTARDGDHAMGLELQLEELVEERNRLETQGEDPDPDLEARIQTLQLELAATVEPHAEGRAMIHAPMAGTSDRAAPVSAAPADGEPGPAGR